MSNAQDVQQKPMRYYLPVVLFLAVVFGLGAVAVVAAVRAHENIPDFIIKTIAGWAALIAALFGPFVVIVWVWGKSKAKNKKVSGVLFALLGIAAVVWLMRFVFRSIF